MRVVLDTNILARANPKAKGPARRLLLDLAESTDHVLLLSSFILRETERVLSYPRLQRIWPLDPDDIADYIGALEEFSELVPLPFKPPPVLRDPDDDPVLQTALAGRADVLCTLDRHFHAPDVRNYCRSVRLEVLTDVELLATFRNPS